MSGPRDEPIRRHPDYGPDPDYVPVPDAEPPVDQPRPPEPRPRDNVPDGDDGDAEHSA